MSSPEVSAKDRVLDWMKNRPLNTFKSRTSAPVFMDPFVKNKQHLVLDKLCSSFDHFNFQGQVNTEITLDQTPWYKYDSHNLRNKLDREITIVLCGGMGDLTTRFLASGVNDICEVFPALRGKLKFIVVDDNPDDERKSIVNKALGGKVEFYTSEEYRHKFSNKELNKPDLFFIATPNNVHIENIEHYQKLFGKDQPLYVIEKPAVIPSQIDQFESAIKGIPRGGIVCCDFYHYSAGAGFLFHTGQGKEMLRQLGKVRRITGDCIEKQPVEPWRGWLRIKGKGDGMFPDCVIHPQTYAITFLENLNKLHGSKIYDPTGFSLTHAFNGSYDLKLNPDLYGTYAALRAVSNDGSLIINMIGGKGVAVDENAYTMKVWGEKGALVVSHGGAYPSYAHFFRYDHGTSSQLIVFEHPSKSHVSVGYGGVLYSLIAAAFDREGSKDFYTSPESTLIAANHCLRMYQDILDANYEQYAYTEGEQPRIFIPNDSSAGGILGLNKEIWP